MSNTSSTVATPEDTTPRAPNLAFQSPLPVPETPILTMPIGKYHPSNYKLAGGPSLGGSGVAPTSSPIQALPTTSLQIPPKSNKRTQPHHERRTSDVKRKLQQYQRDMIAQARLASSLHTHGHSHSHGGMQGGGRVKPDSPKLMPLGSPGPITPFELEESAGYLVAGARAGTQGGEKEREMVGRMIREEEQRMGARGSPGSPVLI